MRYGENELSSGGSIVCAAKNQGNRAHRASREGLPGHLSQVTTAVMLSFFVR
jgi:hypothetical protein